MATSSKASLSSHLVPLSREKSSGRHVQEREEENVKKPRLKIRSVKRCEPHEPTEERQLRVGGSLLGCHVWYVRAHCRSRHHYTCSGRNSIMSVCVMLSVVNIIDPSRYPTPDIDIECLAPFASSCLLIGRQNSVETANSSSSYPSCYLTFVCMFSLVILSDLFLNMTML